MGNICEFNPTILFIVIKLIQRSDLTYSNSHCNYQNYQVEYITSGINPRDVRHANSFAPFYFSGGMRIRGRTRLM